MKLSCLGKIAFIVMLVARQCTLPGDGDWVSIDKAGRTRNNQ